MFVCSKGKREYIQLLWLMLDPLGQLIPESGRLQRRVQLQLAAYLLNLRPGPAGQGPPGGERSLFTTCLAHTLLCWLRAVADWDSRLTSTFPDTLTQAANKTALTALGCYDITKVDV